MTRASNIRLPAVAVAWTLAMHPAPVYASSFAGLWTLVLAMMVGIPLGLLLMVQIGVGIYFMRRPEPRPVFARLSVILPLLGTGIYVLFPAGTPWREYSTHLLFSMPIVLLSGVSVAVGAALWRRTSPPPSAPPRGG